MNHFICTHHYKSPISIRFYVKKIVKSLSYLYIRKGILDYSKAQNIEVLIPLGWYLYLIVYYFKISGLLQ